MCVIKFTNGLFSPAAIKQLRREIHMSKWLIPLCTATALAGVGCDKATQIMNATSSTLSTQETHLGKKIDVAQWNEEVQLFDGRMVIVGRKVTAYAGGFPNSERGRDISTEVTFEPMGITWKHEMSASNLRHPIAFEISNGVAYLVLYIGDKASCKDKPSTQYLAQVIKWVNGQWVEVPLSEFPSDKALLNLYSDFWGHTAKDDAKGLIPWEGKTTGGKDNDTIKTFMERGNRFCDFYQKS